MSEYRIERIGDATLYLGDCREILPTLAAQSVDCCVTSPPYFGLRDYGHETQIGLESTPAEFVDALVRVFREVRRVLRDDGTVWLNLGDSYCAAPNGNKDTLSSTLTTRSDGTRKYDTPQTGRLGASKNMGNGASDIPRAPHRGRGAWIKPKDLIGIPWRVAFALQADGWYLRSDIIWHKPNPMPESVTDRPTKSHEYLFLLAKSERYYYDADAIKEQSVTNDPRRPYGSPGANALDGREVPQGQGRLRAPANRKRGEFDGKTNAMPGHEAFRAFTEMRNARTVWTIATSPFKGAPFATFPPALIEPCILAGCPVGGTVLDPFGGSGTVGVVAAEHGRKSVLCELNADYLAIQRERITAAYAQHRLFA